MKTIALEKHGWRGHNPEAFAQTGISVRHKKETGG